MVCRLATHSVTSLGIVRYGPPWLFDRSELEIWELESCASGSGGHQQAAGLRYPFQPTEDWRQARHNRAWRLRLAITALLQPSGTPVCFTLFGSEAQQACKHVWIDVSPLTWAQSH